MKSKNQNKSPGKLELGFSKKSVNPKNKSPGVLGVELPNNNDKKTKTQKPEYSRVTVSAHLFFKGIEHLGEACLSARRARVLQPKREIILKNKRKRTVTSPQCFFCFLFFVPTKK
ncbi:hypothetical protein DID76_03245 [Candidatus Marinamargulisbacteria bacterium SCGC AG-414-C22]|nr:hypothetical protein DID76_03245 [Candidatus Marinamargulisbacteria bacterium SCGC AG-414-C22]